jgi:Na+-translocating ferredoxin:NAD+ oxidoreductase RnfE subunit
MDGGLSPGMGLNVNNKVSRTFVASEVREPIVVVIIAMVNHDHDLTSSLAMLMMSYRRVVVQVCLHGTETV